MRYGLVGGTPRELVAAQLETERERCKVEAMKVAATQEDIVLRKQRVQIEGELKKVALQQQAQQVQQRHQINPQNGFRG